MKTGKRIHSARLLKDKTMKEIGIEMHYPISSAAVRIAQYEKGLRIPNDETLDQLAKVLQVNRKALTGPEGYETDDVIRFLLELEDEGYDISIRADGSDMIVMIKSESLNKPLMVWNSIRTEYYNDEISRKDYITWKFCWDPSEPA